MRRDKARQHERHTGGDLLCGSLLFRIFMKSGISPDRSVAAIAVPQLSQDP
jgi:hypothetical protein